MRCLKCGAVIPDDAMFCPKCASPVHIVPDYSGLENLLASEVNELLDEEDAVYPFDSEDSGLKTGGGYSSASEERSRRRTSVTQARQAEEKRRKESLRKQKQRRRRLIAFGVVLAVVLVLAAVLVFMVGTNSYRYQMRQADKSYDREEYEKAYSSYVKASELQPGLPAPLTGMGRCLIRTDREGEAVDILKQALQLDPGDPDTYYVLAQAYEADGKLDEITSLFSDVTDEKVLKACDEYVAQTPAASVPGGSFQEEITISLDAGSDPVYYTLDGTRPGSSSERYTAPLTLSEDGEYILNAVSINDKGISSPVLTESYSITIPVLYGPNISPATGKYYSAQTVTMDIPLGCSVYYTLDGSTPTTASFKYSGSFELDQSFIAAQGLDPDHITVSAIAVSDDTGRQSSVTKRVYEFTFGY